MVKGNWLNGVKKIFGGGSPSHDERQVRSKKRWRFRKSTRSDPGPVEVEVDAATEADVEAVPPEPDAVEVTGVNPTGFDHELVRASAVAAEAAAIAAHAAAEVVRLTAATSMARAGPSRPNEEIAAATRIQSAFRGYLARRILRALRGLVRLKLLVDGGAVKRQTKNMLYATQMMTAMQLQIHLRRVQISEEKLALQKQLQHKRELDLQKLKLSEDWDNRHQSKEQIEASLQTRQEAAMRRERALAYSYSHQWRNSSYRPVNTLTFIESSILNWGWSWTERWMASSAPMEAEADQTNAPEDPAAAHIAGPSRPSLAHVVSSSKSSFGPNRSNRRLLPAQVSRTPPPAAGRIRSKSLSRDGDSASVDDSIPSYMQSTELSRLRDRRRSVELQAATLPNIPPSRRRLSLDSKGKAPLISPDVRSG